MFENKVKLWVVLVVPMPSCGLRGYTRFLGTERVKKCVRGFCGVYFWTKSIEKCAGKSTKEFKDVYLS